MFLKYFFGFIVVSTVLYANDKPKSSETNFIKGSASLESAKVTTGRKHKAGLLSVAQNSSRHRYIKRHKKRYTLSRGSVRFQSGLYQKISLDDFGIDQGVQRDGLVKAIKSEMLRLGCYQGRIDAVWGEGIRSELEDLDRGLPTLTAEKITLNYLKKQRSLGCSGNQGWDRLTNGEKGSVEVTGSIQTLETMVKTEHKTQPRIEASKKHKAKPMKHLKLVHQRQGRQKPLTVKKAKAKPALVVKKENKAKAAKFIVAKKPALKTVADKKLVQSVRKTQAKRTRRKRRHARKKFGTDSVFGIDYF